MASILRNEFGQAEGAFRTIDLRCPAETLGLSAGYREYCQSWDLRHQLSGVFHRSDDAASIIVAVRGKREGPCVEPAFAVLRSLMPHFRRAALFRRDPLLLSANLAALTAWLERSPYALLVTDSHGRVVYAKCHREPDYWPRRRFGP